MSMIFPRSDIVRGVADSSLVQVLYHIDTFLSSPKCLSKCILGRNVYNEFNVVTVRLPGPEQPDGRAPGDREAAPVRRLLLLRLQQHRVLGLRHGDTTSTNMLQKTSRLLSFVSLRQLKSPKLSKMGKKGQSA